MNRVILLIISIFILFCLYSCAYYGKSSNAELMSLADPKAIMVHVTELLYSEQYGNTAVGIMITDSDLDKANAYEYLNKNFEDFKYDKYESFALYPSAMSNVPDEYGIIKLKDKKDLGYTAAMLKKRIECLYSRFEGDAKLAKLVKNAQIRNAGRYIYYAVTNQNEHILTYIENMLANS